MEKRTLFYGTPLSRCLNDRQVDNDGPINSRRARLNQQQTVRDAQGRQRFHGAFTGGFSAGYYNTVDSVEGFKPRHFVSHRGAKKDEASSSKFTHKPEDYMDDEDMGEFGIAPKKIRVSSHFSDNDPSVFSKQGAKNELLNLLKLTEVSIGEQILKRMGLERGYSKCDTVGIDIVHYLNKSDFHGLGYRPLIPNQKNLFNQSSSNSLIAILNKGKRLEISGEAFGSGVLEDDEDFLDTNDAYGYDSIRNYNFDAGSTSTLKMKTKHNIKTNCNLSQDQDYWLLPGFVLAQDQNAMFPCDNIEKKFPPPYIPTDWKAPVRATPYIPPVDTAKISLKLNQKVNQLSSLFNKKFISGSGPIKPDDLGTKSGLVHYSDLKAAVGSFHKEAECIGDSEEIEATISRQKLEWRPCGLLCNRFNIPNPFPDNLFSGVKQTRPIEQNKAREDFRPEEVGQTFATLEFKRSIFDVIFLDKSSSDETELVAVDEEHEIESDEEPQVVECNMLPPDQDDESKSDEDPDIEVVPAPLEMPEVIVLTSSSSSSPSPSYASEDTEKSQSRRVESDDLDTYGPPLPPTLKTLIDSGCHQLISRNRQSYQRKKNKKHRKHSKQRS